MTDYISCLFPAFATLFHAYFKKEIFKYVHIQDITKIFLCYLTSLMITSTRKVSIGVHCYFIHITSDNFYITFVTDQGNPKHFYAEPDNILHFASNSLRKT